MTHLPTFSILMPTHARPTLLREAIQSVIAQTYEDWELVVVDDGSPVPAQVPDDPRVRLIRREVSRGPAAARNSARAQARGRIIAFLDDDDLWRENRLGNALFAHEHADIVICAGAEGVDPRPDAHRPGEAVRGGPAHDWILSSTAPHLGRTSVARDWMVAFDEQFTACEDLDWWLRVTAPGCAVAKTQDPDFFWRRHDGPRHLIGTQARLAGQFMLLERHTGYFRTHREARAFRWRRIAALQRALGNRSFAMGAAIRSLGTLPTRGAAAELVRSALGSVPTARAPGGNPR